MQGQILTSAARTFLVILPLISVPLSNLWAGDFSTLFANALMPPGMSEKMISYLDPASQRCVAQVNRHFRYSAQEAYRLQKSLTINHSKRKSLQDILSAYPDGSRMESLRFAGYPVAPRAEFTVADLQLIVVKFPHLTFLDLSSEAITDAHLAPLKRLTQLASLILNHTRVSNEGLVQLKELPKLKHLNLAVTSVTGVGLEHLKDLPELVTLNLAQTTVTNNDLTHLKLFKQLTSLNLTGTAVGDAGLLHLLVHQQLTTLSLFQTEVTDDGLDILKHLNQLNTLELMLTNVTKPGVANLKLSKPKLKIFHR